MSSQIKGIPKRLSRRIEVSVFSILFSIPFEIFVFLSIKYLFLSLTWHFNREYFFVGSNKRIKQHLALNI